MEDDDAASVAKEERKVAFARLFTPVRTAGNRLHEEAARDPLPELRGLPGEQGGDWLLTTCIIPEATDAVLKRLRQAEHAVIIKTKQFFFPVLVHPATCTQYIWGGEANAELEITPAGMTRTKARVMHPGSWVANLGSHTAFVDIKPLSHATNKGPPTKLEIPPGRKAAMAVENIPVRMRGRRTYSRAVCHQEHPRAVRATRASGERKWISDGITLMPNAYETTLVWYSPVADPQAQQEENKRGEEEGEPVYTVASLNVHGSVGKTRKYGEARLREILEHAEERRIKVLFLIGTGEPRTELRECGEWRINWAPPGDTEEEG
eukprot:gene37562-66706_t